MHCQKSVKMKEGRGGGLFILFYCIFTEYVKNPDILPRWQVHVTGLIW